MGLKKSAGPINTFYLRIFRRRVFKDTSYIKRLLDKTDDFDKSGIFDRTRRTVKSDSGIDRLILMPDKRDL